MLKLLPFLIVNNKRKSNIFLHKHVAIIMDGGGDKGKTERKGAMRADQVWR